MTNKFPYQAVHYSPAGFILLKSQPTGNLVCESYKSASLPTLQRECGVFFDTPAESTLVTVNFTPPLLVPKAIYQPPAAQYLRLQSEIADNDEIFQDDLGEYVALYAIPLAKTLPIKTMLPAPTFQHTATRLYHYLAQYSTEQPNKLLLHISGNKMGFILIKNNKLFIINELPFTCPEDVLYHTLNILLQQEARREESAILLSGASGDVQKCGKLLARYLKHVKMAGAELTHSVINLKSQPTELHTCLQLIEIQ